MKRKSTSRTAITIAAYIIILILLACVCVRLCSGSFWDTILSGTKEEETENLSEESGSGGAQAGEEHASAETGSGTDASSAESGGGAEGGSTEAGESENSSAQTGSAETGGSTETETSSGLTEEGTDEGGDETQTLDLSSVTAVLYHEGGGTISDFISGVTCSSVLDWLSLHREDDYYLGTPYPAESDGTLTGGAHGSTDRRNPNGDCETAYGNDDYEGVSMLNCTGFVWHVLYKASGMTEEEAFDTIPCWGGVGAKDWISWLRKSNVEYKTYYGSADSLETLVAAMIADGYMEPGDIIWTWGEGTVIASDGLPSKSVDPHVGIYTGTYFGGEADEWWHSLGYSTATDTFYGENLYGSITPIAPCVAMTVIKLGNSAAGAESE